MGFRFDFTDKTLLGYVGKTVNIVFTDGESMTCRVLGFTTAANNEEGIASIDVSCEYYDAWVSILENEIESIEPAE